MTSFISWINTWILAPTVPSLLTISGIWIASHTHFFFLFRIKTILRTLFQPNAHHPKQSPIQSMTVALAGTLGVGNITGVASAILSGGIGAIFWMWIGAFLSIPVKYAEVVLAVRHRIRKPNGTYVGGAMYYMNRRWLTTLFAVLCLFASLTLGNLLQMQAVAEATVCVFQIPMLPVAAVLSVFLFIAIRKGIRRISAVTAILVPVMSFLYLIMALLILLPHIRIIPSLFLKIVQNAFHPSAALGGFGSFLFMRSMRFGIARGLISNESGCGTAPIAHASADTESAAQQGFWGIFEVFADTMIMCSLTAFVLLLSIDCYPQLDGMELVLACFSRYLGKSSEYLLSLCVFFFATATMVSWSYYGTISLEYLIHHPKIHRLYLLMFAIMIIPGSLIKKNTVWQITDFCIGIMTVLNTSFLLTRTREISAETDAFFRYFPNSSNTPNTPNSAYTKPSPP